jgi:hypothetical protein
MKDLMALILICGACLLGLWISPRDYSTLDLHKFGIVMMFIVAWYLAMKNDDLRAELAAEKEMHDREMHYR